MCTNGCEQKAWTVFQSGNFLRADDAALRRWHFAATASRWRRDCGRHSRVTATALPQKRAR
ncbi:hypothetical protein BZM26_18695 [Paraburkholderia strydomiana]|nr:hypothetical protein BZM26_18695 [Paraburkholderia strydomiana]